MKEIAITVFNNEANWYYRRSPVEISLAKIRAKYDLGNFWPWKTNTDKADVANKIRVLDDANKPVPSQIDILDPHDRTKDTLVFLAEVPYTSSTYYISEAKLGKKAKPRATIKSTKEEGQLEDNSDFMMRNEKIELKIHKKMRYQGGEAFENFGGSASQVRIKNNQIVNPFGDYSLNKFMQIENIEVCPPFHSASDEGLYPPKGYEYVNKGEGPIRCFLTIRYPFEIKFENPLPAGPGKVINLYECYIYRTIRLYSEKYYVKEDIYANAKRHKMLYEVNGAKKEIESKEVGDINYPLYFKTKFFSYLPELDPDGPSFKSYRPEITYRPEIRVGSWFALGNDRPPHYPGIGFACNCDIENIKDIPHIEWPYGAAIRWWISPTWHLECLHLFMDNTNTEIRGETHDFGHVVGSNWYNEIYAPLWGE